MIKSSRSKNDSSHFLSLADMMTVLMMVFMLVAVISMRNSLKKNELVREVAITYQETQHNLYQDLFTEFEHDLKKWDASLDQETLSITFESPDILFYRGEARLRNSFKVILKDFFPRYIRVIEESYSDEIEEIRIEGYTDSDGVSNFNEVQNYFFNMQLSQGRTRNVLEYCMNLPFAKEKFKWMTDHLTANGLSFSRLKYTNGVEDKEKSRRVEFRVRTKSDVKMRQIIEKLGT